MALVTRTLEEVRRRSRVARPKRVPKSEKEIRKAAQSDPDNPPLTEEDLERFKPWRERKKAKAKELSEVARKFDDKK